MLAASFLLFQFLRGIMEGVRMYQPGPRLHPWFPWYHIADVGTMVMLAGSVYFAVQSFPGWLFFAGLSILAWEAFELSYRWARRGQAAAHENILGLWAFNGPVWWLHAARAGIGVALMIGGIK